MKLVDFSLTKNSPWISGQKTKQEQVGRVVGLSLHSDTNADGSKSMFPYFWEK